MLGGAALFLLSCTRPEVIDDGGTAEAGVLCTEARDCDDGVFCNGLELCLPAADGTRCYPGVLPCRGACDESGGGCLGCTPADADRDDHDALACGGDDCDDADPARHPGAREVCDAADLDEDCVAETFGIRDDDGDGATSSACCNEGHCGPDCNDRSTEIAPGLSETCDDTDQDCDGRVDEEASLTCVVPTALSSVCRDGSCVVERCAVGRADCNGRPGDGCERDLTSDAATCSSCDVFCEGSEACVAGRCEGERCPAGQHTCPSGCAFNDDVASCGTRCEPCPTIAGATTTCESGACVDRCPSGAAPTPDDAGILWCPPRYPIELWVTVETGAEFLVTPLSGSELTATRSEMILTVQNRPFGEGEFRIGGETRRSGEPFSPRVLTPGANTIPIELWYADRLVSSGQLHLRFLETAPYETAELHAGAVGDQFGYAVAIDGERIVVGAPGDPGDGSMSGAGAAYVFQRRAGAWILEAYLRPHDSEAGARFGGSVAIDGEQVVVGAEYASGTLGERAAGAAYVFEPVGSAWEEITRLVPPAPDPNDGFGTSVAIHADTIAVGAPNEDGRGLGLTGDPTDDSGYDLGAVYTFARDATGWSFAHYIKRPSDRDYQFGRIVRLGGASLVVSGVNRVEAFERTATSWTSSGTFPARWPFPFDLDREGATLVTETDAGTQVREHIEGAWSLVSAAEPASSLAVDGTRMVILAAGRMTPWERGTEGWIPSTVLLPPRTGGYNGALDLSGNVIVAGAVDAVAVFTLGGS